MGNSIYFKQHFQNYYPIMPQPIIHFNYDAIIEKLNDAKIDTRDVFYYNETPLENEFKRILDSGQTFLSYYDRELNIYPARLYFNNATDFNAAAGYSNGIYIITLNAGVIVHAHHYFMDKDEELKNSNLEYIKEADRLFPDPVCSLMRDFCVKFTFDHEYAHLIQRSGSTSNWVEPEYLKNESATKYSIEQHLKEFDADYRGSIGLIGSIIAYWNDLKEDIRTRENLSTLMVMGISSILCSFCGLVGFNKDIYFDKYTHPHPLVRLRYIFEFCKRNFEYRNVILPDWAMIFNKSLELTTQIFIRDSETFNKQFVELNKKYDTGISNYIKTVLEANLPLFPRLCLNNSSAYNLEPMNWMKIASLAMSIGEETLYSGK